MINSIRRSKDKLESPALGVERIGLISLRFPQFILLGLVVLSIFAAFGVARMKVDDSLSQLFRSNDSDFRVYADESRRFPSSEFDVLVAVEGKRLLERKPLSELRNVVTDIQLIDGAKGLISLFSAREPPRDGQVPRPLFPEVLPKGADYARLIARVRANEIIRGKLLSHDGRLALIVLALDPKLVESRKLADVIGEIRKTVDQDLAGSGLKAELSGVPVMQLEIRKAVERDRVIYNAFGFAAGCLIAAFFFRRLSFVFIAAGPPLIAILLSFGAFGWLGFRLNMFLNMMTPLIMVISFSDSMQLTYAMRERLVAGENKYDAARGSIRIVGPACVLTHVTAAISFAALQVSSSTLIQTFGRAGLLSTVIALIATLTLFPLFSLLFMRDERALAEEIKHGDQALRTLRDACRWIAHRMVIHAGRYSLIALLVTICLGFVYAQLQPRYRLSDQVPDRGQALQASTLIDAKLAGANPIDVLIDFPKGQTLYSPETLATIAGVHSVLERQPGVVNVWSLETLRRWLADKTGKSSVETLKRYFDALPKFLTRRFVSAKADAAVVTGRIPDLDASQILSKVGRLEDALKAVRAKHPGYKIAVTGLLVVAARSNANMIGRLNQALTVEVLFVSGFIGLAFRSLRAMLASILPALFPVFASGGVLWATHKGLQLSSLIALIVSFGIGLSATIHFLNRLRLENANVSEPSKSVELATVLVGPPLILTSMVLACSLLVTIFSDLPFLRLFGWLSAYAMLAALAADLFILRPIIVLLNRLRI